MKIVPARPFTFEAGKRAVLLLHGFTGNTADVRMLGRFLQEKGYTCHAPLYQGHGVEPEELVTTGPDDWWADVIDGYEFLKNLGHEEIAVCGLSLGGVFTLKLGYSMPVKGIVPMCAPMTTKTEEVMYKGVLKFAKEYKRKEQKTTEQVELEMEKFKPMTTLVELQNLIMDVRRHLDHIYAPLFVVQARHDEMIDIKSANVIFETVESIDKRIKWYENSSHVITFDQEKDMLHEDLYQFLETLNWTVK